MKHGKKLVQNFNLSSHSSTDQLNDVSHVHNHPAQQQAVAGREVSNYSNEGLNFLLFVLDG